jgi:hypothetical protein
MSKTRPTGISGILLATSLIVLMLGAGACATSRQTRSVETHGFLGDYSQLREGKGKEAQRIYINPNANWRDYDAVMIDSVTLWHTAKTSKLSAEDAQMLTDHFYTALHEELAKDYRIADQPGPGVMRIRAAVTEAKGAKVLGNAVTSIYLPAKAASTIVGVATNTQVWVGAATVEAEIRDSMSNVRLAAAVDERAGTKNPFVGLKKWSQVKRVLEVWAENLRERLSELRAG